MSVFSGFFFICWFIFTTEILTGLIIVKEWFIYFDFINRFTRRFYVLVFVYCVYLCLMLLSSENVLQELTWKAFCNSAFTCQNAALLYKSNLKSVSLPVYILCCPSYQSLFQCVCKVSEKPRHHTSWKARLHLKQLLAQNATVALLIFFRVWGISFLVRRKSCGHWLEAVATWCFCAFSGFTVWRDIGGRAVHSLENAPRVKSRSFARYWPGNAENDKLCNITDMSRKVWKRAPIILDETSMERKP